MKIAWLFTVLIGLTVGASVQAATLMGGYLPGGNGTLTANLGFYPTETSTTISIGGYVLSGNDGFDVQNINLVLYLSDTNLLNPNWQFTSAPSNSDANQSSDGIYANALFFGGTNSDPYDTFSQTFSTTPGSLYVLSLNVPVTSNADFLFVTASNSSIIAPGSIPPSVPEPETWTMLIIGMALAGGSLRRVKCSLSGGPSASSRAS